MCLCSVCAHRSSLTAVTQFTVGTLCLCTVEIQSVQTQRAGPTATSFIHSVTMALPVTPGSAKHYWAAGLPSCETWPEVTLTTACKTRDEKLLIYQLIQAMTKHLFPSSEKKEWRMTTCIQQWHYAFWKFTTKFPKISYHHFFIVVYPANPRFAGFNIVNYWGKRNAFLDEKLKQLNLQTKSFPVPMCSRVCRKSQTNKQNLTQPINTNHHHLSILQNTCRFKYWIKLSGQKRE